MLSHIILIESFFQEWYKEQQLFVFSLIAYKGIDRNSIIQVEAEGENGVVNDNHVFLVPVKEDVQILDEELLQLNAILPVESLLKDSPFRIDMIENVVSIVLAASSEHYNFVELGHPF